MMIKQPSWEYNDIPNSEKLLKIESYKNIL